MGPVDDTYGMPLERMNHNKEKVILEEPNVNDLFKNNKGKRVVLDTKRGAYVGRVIGSGVDHVQIREKDMDPDIFIRIQEIVSIMFTKK